MLVSGRVRWLKPHLAITWWKKKSLVISPLPTSMMYLDSLVHCLHWAFPKPKGYQLSNFQHWDVVKQTIYANVKALKKLKTTNLWLKMLSQINRFWRFLDLTGFWRCYGLTTLGYSPGLPVVQHPEDPVQNKGLGLLEAQRNWWNQIHMIHIWFIFMLNFILEGFTQFRRDWIVWPQKCSGNVRFLFGGMPSFGSFVISQMFSI